MVSIIMVGLKLLSFNSIGPLSVNIMAKNLPELCLIKTKHIFYYLKLSYLSWEPLLYDIYFEYNIVFHKMCVINACLLKITQKIYYYCCQYLIIVIKNENLVLYLRKFSKF